MEDYIKNYKIIEEKIKNSILLKIFLQIKVNIMKGCNKYIMMLMICL